MRLESKNAEVTIVWDKEKQVEIIIKAKNGDILFMQMQSPEVTSSTIFQHASWDEVVGA
jgi:hypothetical protein